MSSKERLEKLYDYATYWLAIYNHRDIFDGVVGIGAASIMIEASINDELRLMGKDIVDNILKRLASPNKEGAGE